MSERVHCGRIASTIADVVDAVDLLPHFELAAVAVLDATERPAEWPTIRRRLRAEGVRPREHRGTLLLTPAELERLASVGLLSGQDEIYLMTEWNDELETFPGRIAPELTDFEETTPLGLEEWMVDTGCLLALGDGSGLNFATLDPDLAKRLRSRFPAAKARRS